ncbi:hypothetical protein L1987_09028 [Smallanthus sonchifolius]|uniref:Uncharacterized protein n=1 Tax=Smallanthus sonchifolius TaxID=185202 RepID=A0ACB9JMC1_9ASTR|nr:hypothetical protein L1987_09028 [Smallanthus sonchifolius]
MNRLSTTVIFLFVSTTVTVNSTFILPKTDMNLLKFPINLEFFEAEYFLFGSMGKGLDAIEPDLAAGHRPSAQNRPTSVALSETYIHSVRLSRHKTIRGFPRPLLNLSAESFSTVMNAAFGIPLSPQFDPYANDINYLLSCYVIPYVGLTGYVGANPKLYSSVSRKVNNE